MAGEDRDVTPPQADVRSIEARIARGAARQKALATTKQLTRAGLTRHMITTRAGRTLHRMHDGVWIVGAPVLAWGARELGAALTCGYAEGRAVAVCARDACVLHQLLAPRPGPVHVAVARKRRSRPGIVVHVVELLDNDRTTIDGVPVTSVERTLCDFSRSAAAFELERAVNEALARRKTTFAFLVEAADRLRAPKLRAVLGTAKLGHTKSRGERRLLRGLRAAGGDPELVNGKVLDELVDFAWLSARLVVEVDEHATHGTRKRFEDGYGRNLRFRRAGWDILRFTTDQVNDELDVIVALILATVARRRSELSAA